MTDHTNLQSRCQRGEASLSGANNLLAECHAALGQLMAENKRLSRSVGSLIQVERATGNRAIEYAGKCDQLRAEVAGLSTGYEAYERVNAELKAENETLRKDAERYRWLRIGGYLHSQWRHMPDQAIDAAMGKGE